MYRCLVVMILTCVVLPADVAMGQEKLRLTPKGPQGKDGPSRDVPRLIALDISPAAEPVPPLEYSFVPGYLEQTPGNAVPYYYRALMNLKQLGGVMRGPLNQGNFDQWMEGPLDEFPVEEVRAFVDQYTTVFNELKIAVYREECRWDWQLRRKTGTEPIAFVLSEIQESRELARLLVLKSRVEIADGRYDDALETIRWGYQLARDVAKPPILINGLVGIAITYLMNEQVLTLINAPDSPNLYWALAALPDPFLNIEPAMRHEMSIPALMFPFLKDAETAQHVPEEWNNILTDCIRELAAIGLDMGSAGKPGWQGRLATTALLVQGYPRAKKHLHEWGYDADDVEKMSVGQVIAIHQSRTYKIIYQEMFKWTLLSEAKAIQWRPASDQKLRSAGYWGHSPTSKSEVIPIAATLLPAISQATYAYIRTDTRLAALRTVEAIRMHAAAHDGQLPEKLSDIDAVPLPNEPATGEPFAYEFDGERGALDIPVPPGRQANINWRIDITIRKTGRDQK